MLSPFDSLPGNFAARAKALVAQREAEGLNVHFIREDGRADRFSMATKERADGLRASLVRQGREVIA